jgi:hypothetical protein
VLNFRGTRIPDSRNDVPSKDLKTPSGKLKFKPTNFYFYQLSPSDFCQYQYLYLFKEKYFETIIVHGSPKFMSMEEKIF